MLYFVVSLHQKPELLTQTIKVMNTEEMTTFGTDRQVKEESKQTSEQTNKNAWQKVTIGGVTGILMGAAGMYAANAFGAEGEQEAENTASGTQAQSHVAENGLKVAEVDDSLSFGDAFAAARNAVGAGGVFHWRGNIYNTFTESEWDHMTPQEHAQFAQQVRPEVRPEEMHTHHESHHDTAQHRPESHKETEQKVEEKPEKDDSEGRRTPEHKEDDNEPEVHYLGVEQRHTEDGEVINVGHMTIDDDDVALVDLDNDQVFDISVSDRNHNNEIEANEVIDISEAGITVTDFALAVAKENGEVGSAQPDVAVNSQDNIGGEDMPDYMNDADIQTI